MATKELYYESPNTYEFTAVITGINRLQDKTELILDQTAFFPEAGGQVCDRGELNGLKVLHVRKDNDTVIHEIEPDDSALSEGDNVTGVIDREYHFLNMQHHTAEHVISGLVHKHFGYDNVGFHLSENTCTMDFNGPLSEADIDKIEALANEIIFKDLPVRVFYPTGDELDKIDYRAKLEAEEMGQVRLVEIPEVDICACCAPHLDSTGKIGIVKVVEHIKYKGGMRLTILSGQKAYADYKSKHESLLALSRKLSVPISEVPDSVEKLSQDIQAQKTAIRELEEKLLEASLVNFSGVLFANISDKILLRNTANRLMDEYEGPVFIFNGDDTKGYSFIIGDKDGDAAGTLHRLSELIDIKGGGKNPMVQGSCSLSREEILSALSKI